MVDYKITEIKSDDLEEAFALVKRVFLEIDAPDYSKEGVQEVMDDMLENKEFKELFKSGEQTMLGAICDDKIVGVVAIGANNHISLAFVDKDYHRKGIAKALFERLFVRLKAKNAKKITLNSTPYAVAFYEKIGFKKTGDCIEKHGVLYTPMQFVL